jgi:nicotinamidase/pyrazinamidase
VVDVQNDFCRGGRLEVADADAVVPLINLLARRFVNVVLTQDWHTPEHASFASSHPGSAPFETLELPYGTQVLWPDHCVQGTPGAALHEQLDVPHAQLVLRKGFHPQIDSYSVFLEADRRTHTGLSGYLALRGIDRVFLAGLTTDFCVAWSALDARRFGFAAVVLEDACRAIVTHGSLASAWTAMTAAGVERARTDQIQAEPMNSAPPM